MKFRSFYSVIYSSLLLITTFNYVILAKSAPKQKKLPIHPSAIQYDSLTWNIPLGNEYRTQLKNGLVCYIATDTKLPMVQITGNIHYGSLLDPSGMEGLSSMLSTMMRNGGTEKYPADTLDDLIDLLALKFSFGASETQFTFNASFLTEYTKEAIDILQQLLFKPVFDTTRLERERSRYLESIKHQFENPEPILSAAYRKNMYSNGEAARLSTEQSIKSITRDDLLELHKKVYRTSQTIIAVAGDFNRDSMIQTLETLFPDDTAKTRVQFPEIAITPRAQCLFVHKPLTQAYVRIGLPLFKRPNDDYYPVSLLNEVLGGSGFTSRLGMSVRSDAGLTYSIYSAAESNYRYPATLYIDFFTKNESFSKASELTLIEITKIAAEKITPLELNNATSSLVGGLPSMFRSPFDIVSTYAWNEFYGRPDTQYKDYPEKLKAITIDQIQTVAKKYLDPSKMTFTIVGDSTALLHQKSGSFSLENYTVTTISPDSLPALP